MADVTRQERPLSPHLTIYRRQISSVMSIFHRFTGLGLARKRHAGGLVVPRRGARARNISRFADGVLTSWIGTLVMLVSLVALWYHFFTGIRHLVWDTGAGLEIERIAAAASPCWSRGGDDRASPSSSRSEGGPRCSSAPIGSASRASAPPATAPDTGGPAADLARAGAADHLLRLSLRPGARRAVGGGARGLRPPVQRRGRDPLPRRRLPASAAGRPGGDRGLCPRQAAAHGAAAGQHAADRGLRASPASSPSPRSPSPDGGSDGRI